MRERSLVKIFPLYLPRSILIWEDGLSYLAFWIRLKINESIIILKFRIRE